MPKQRITKEMVVDAAFEIARKDGIEKATVKNHCGEIGLFRTADLQLLQKYGRTEE